MATTRAEALHRGYSPLYAVEVEGIPYLLVEKDPPRVDATSSASAPATRAVVPALVIDEAQTISQMIDRETGVADGAAVEFVLDFEALSEASVLSSVFARPSARTPIDTDLDSAATTISVDATTGFANGQTVYMGREQITIGTISGGDFTSCTRGVNGEAWDYQATSPSSYREVTDKPVIWRGRFVTLWEHLVSPAGHIVESTWSTGTYARPIWRGYIAEVPLPGAHGMSIRCLPLVRLLGQEVGHEASFRACGAPRVSITPTFGYPLLFDSGTMQLRIKVAYTGGLGTDDYWVTPTAGAYTPTGWANALGAALEAGQNGDAWLDSTLAVEEVGDEVALDMERTFVVRLRIGEGGGMTLDSGQLYVVGGDAPYFLVPGVYDWRDEGDHWSITIPLREHFYEPDSWLVVQEVDGAGWRDASVPSSGVGLLGHGDKKEIVEWDETVDVGLNRTAVHIHGRRLAGTESVDPGAATVLEPVDVNGASVPMLAGVALKVLTGATGTLAEVVQTILSSSGTGDRGTYDTLAIGLGYAIDEDWIDASSLAAYGTLGDEAVVALAEERSSLADLIGGVLVLGGLCLVQIYDSTSGEVRIAARLSVTGSWSARDASVITIDAADLLLRQATPLRMLPAPNEIKVKTSSLAGDGTTLAAVDVPRVQQEGPQAWDIDAAGLDSSLALHLAAFLIALGDGQSALELSAAPWLDVQPGDRVILDLDHPMIYDWASGARAASNVSAVVLGVSRDLISGEQRITILLAGQALPARYLAPTATVMSKSGNDITLDTGEGEYFDDGETIQIETPGAEASPGSEITTRVISTVAGDVLTLTVAPPAWVAADATVTHPAYTSCTAEQQAFLFIRSDQYWGAT